ncbi:unnamed protein product [Protopolystoma xenopodis]|uniref:Uncharacterized protein n=2 Tax=Protopolystoma xenopodis TaxID=117903 RepID=A0A448XN54_9PLAT|nr:unnamed protein product [Protopolystoma xenopodis]
MDFIGTLTLAINWFTQYSVLNDNVSKAATDRMSADMAFELRRHQANIAVFSLWPGAVQTETIQALIDSNAEIGSIFDG